MLNSSVVKCYLKSNYFYKKKLFILCLGYDFKVVSIERHLLCFYNSFPSPPPAPQKTTLCLHLRVCAEEGPILSIKTSA